MHTKSKKKQGNIIAPTANSRKVQRTNYMIIELIGICQYYDNGKWITTSDRPQYLNCEKSDRSLFYDLFLHRKALADEDEPAIKELFSHINEPVREWNRPDSEEWKWESFKDDVFGFGYYTIRDIKEYYKENKKYLFEASVIALENMIEELCRFQKGSDENFRFVFAVW